MDPHPDSGGVVPDDASSDVDDDDSSVEDDDGADDGDEDRDEDGDGDEERHIRRSSMVPSHTCTVRAPIRHFHLSIGPIIPNL